MNNRKKKDLRLAGFEEIAGFLESCGEKKFRARQVWEWLWKKAARSIDEMTSLSLQTREAIAGQYEIYPLQIEEKQVSADKTIKVTFKLPDGLITEGVLIPSRGRMTACISSQVGCNMGCRFCATGMLGFHRNLIYPEIFDQVVLLDALAKEHYQHSLSNIVLMGMGEPLLNYDNVLKVIDILTSDEGLAMSPSRITLSTVGIAKMIKKLGDDRVKFKLALSLHAANDKKRSLIMPVNESNSLEKLTESLKHYHQSTHNRINIEYLLLGKFNDTVKDARELARFCKNFPVKINLIHYNEVVGTSFKRSGEEQTRQFVETLEGFNLIVNVRKSRGKDISAACGQLAGKKENRTT